MIVVVENTKLRGADVYVVFRELWWAAKGSAIYSDQRGQFIANAMRAMTTEACAGSTPADAGPQDLLHSVEAFMRRLETERLDTPGHLLALGRLLGRYVLSDESYRDTRLLDRARAGLLAAWWSCGLDPGAVRVEI
jgi:hypothetical protein